MNLIKTTQSLNKGKTFYYDYIISKNGTKIRVYLLVSVRKMFLSKAFSMSEMDIHKILRLNYYKKLQEWWTEMLMENVLVLVV